MYFRGSWSIRWETMRRLAPQIGIGLMAIAMLPALRALPDVFAIGPLSPVVLIVIFAMGGRLVTELASRPAHASMAEIQDAIDLEYLTKLGRWRYALWHGSFKDCGTAVPMFAVFGADH